MSQKELNLAKEDTTLSKKRTLLSATRTFLSHIRTSAVMLSLAFAFMKLDKEHPIDTFTIILLCLSGFFLIIGIVDFFVTKRYVNTLGDNN